MVVQKKRPSTCIPFHFLCAVKGWMKRTKGTKNETKKRGGQLVLPLAVRGQPSKTFLNRFSIQRRNPPTKTNKAANTPQTFCRYQFDFITYPIWAFRELVEGKNMRGGRDGKKRKENKDQEGNSFALAVRGQRVRLLTWSNSCRHFCTNKQTQQKIKQTNFRDERTRQNSFSVSTLATSKKISTRTVLSTLSSYFGDQWRGTCDFKTVWSIAMIFMKIFIHSTEVYNSRLLSKSNW